MVHEEKFICPCVHPAVSWALLAVPVSVWFVVIFSEGDRHNKCLGLYKDTFT